MTPSNHSDEAEYTPTFDQVRGGYMNGIHSIKRDPTDADKFRRGQGFDRAIAVHDAEVVAAAHAKQHAATREQIARIVFNVYTATDSDFTWDAVQSAGVTIYHEIADALLAPDGPLLDAGEVCQEVVDYLRKRGHLASADAVEFDFITYREARP